MIEFDPASRPLFVRKYDDRDAIVSKCAHGVSLL